MRFNAERLREALNILKENGVISPVAQAETAYNINEQEKDMEGMYDAGEDLCLQ